MKHTILQIVETYNTIHALLLYFFKETQKQEMYSAILKRTNHFLYCFSTMRNTESNVDVVETYLVIVYYGKEDNVLREVVVFDVSSQYASFQEWHTHTTIHSLSRVDQLLLSQIEQHALRIQFKQLSEHSVCVASLIRFV